MKKEILSGLLLDERCELTLAELSQACCVHAEWIIQLVDEGIIEPSCKENSHWRFSGSSLYRARTTRRLQEDLRVNLAGAALVLEMMDELKKLRTRIKVLEGEG